MCFEAMILAKFLGCTGSVEITKRNKPKAMNGIVPAQNFFEDHLRFAIGIDWTLRRLLVDRQSLGRAEGCASGGEKETPHVCCDQRTGQIEAGRSGSAKILGRTLH